MEVQLLTKTIMTAAEALGYSTVVGDVTQKACSLPELPALCLSRPVLRDKQGRQSGVITYRLESSLIQPADEIDVAADEETSREADTKLLQTLYNHALTIIEAVDALDEVCDVACISSTPSKGRVTPYGDVTLKLVFDVKLKFRK